MMNKMIYFITGEILPTKLTDYMDGLPDGMTGILDPIYNPIESPIESPVESSIPN